MTAAAAQPSASSPTTTVVRRVIGAKSAYSTHASSFRSVTAYTTPGSCSSSTRRLTTTSAAIPSVPPTPTPTPHAPPVFDWVALDEEKKIWSDFEDNDEAVLVQDLRSDHAGETGAVWIYAGAKVCMFVREEEEEGGFFLYMRRSFFICLYACHSLLLPLSFSTSVSGSIYLCPYLFLPLSVTLTYTHTPIRRPPLNSALPIGTPPRPAPSPQPTTPPKRSTSPTSIVC